MFVRDHGQRNKSEPREPSTWPWLVCGLLLIAWFCLSPNYLNFQDGGTTPVAGDFLQEWIGGYIVWNHGASRLYDDSLVKQLQHDRELLGFEWEESRHFSMVYPPFYYVLLSPVSLIPYPIAACLFTVAMVACLFAAGYCLFRGSGTNGAWLFAAALMFVPLIRSLTTGQKGTLCLLILTGTYCLLKSGRPIRAGVVFGLLAFKPQLALVIGIAMLIKRQFRFAFSALATALVGVAICLALGLDVCTKYCEFCSGVSEYLHTSGYHLYKSHCLYGFITLLAGGKATLMVKIATVLATIFLFGLLLKMLRGRFDTTGANFEMQFSALVVATLLLSPHVFTYDLTILLLPMFLFVRSKNADDLAWPANLARKRLVGVMFIVAGFSHVVAASCGIQLTTLVMLAMLVTLVYERIGNREEQPGTLVRLEVRPIA